MSHYQLFLLGPFRTALDGAPVAGLTSPKLQGLLAYLALEADGLWPRDQLAALLWPEKPEARAAHSLRQGLYRLGKLLGGDGRPAPLLTTRQTVALNPEAALWFDAVALEAALAETGAHAHEALAACPACYARLEEALPLYQGPLLAGIEVASEPFEEWLASRRRQLEARVLAGLAALVAHDEAREAWAAAEDHARRQIKVAPWQERGHRQLLRVLAAQGRRSAALAAYERCRRALAEGLGIEPGAETVALYQAIRQAGEAPRAAPAAPPPPLPPTNLPRPVTPFVGRARELAEIGQRLDRPSCALLTILGPGGAGKTRLAVEVAGRRAAGYRDGVCFVPLAALDDPALLPLAIATHLGVSLAGREDPAERLLAHLHARELLLLLDNAEHLVAADAEGLALLPRLLQAAPGVQLLVTSRVALNFHAEWLYEIEGLPYGQNGESLAPAPALFVELARRRQPAFDPAGAGEAVYALCRLVEGLPLALELAAAQLPALSCTQLVAAVAANLDTLATAMPDLPPRQRSLGAVFRSSWELLAEQEAAVLRRLSAFRGSFDPEAAAAVAEATPALLAALLDKSFLRVEEEGRYQMHEVLRAYVARELGAAAPATHRRHATYYAAYVEARHEELNGARQQEGLARMGRDFDNVMAAWRRALAWGDAPLLGHFVDGLWAYLDDSGLYRSGLAIFERALAAQPQAAAQPGAAVPPATDAGRVWANVRKAAGFFHQSLGQYPQARSHYEQSLVTYRRLGDVEQSARCLYYLGSIAGQAGELEEARAYLQEALDFFRRLESERYIANTTATLGSILEVMGRYAEAEEMLQQALLLKRARGNPLSTAVTLNNLALLLWRTGRYAEAEAAFREGLALRREVGNPGKVALGLSNLACLLISKGEYEAAHTLLVESLALEETVQNKRHTTGTLNYMGTVLHLLGRAAEARAYLEEAVALAQETGNRREEAHALLSRARVLLDEGRAGAAEAMLARTLSLAAELQLTPLVLATLVPVARLLPGRGRQKLAASVLAHPLQDPAAWYDSRQEAAALAAEMALAPERAGVLAETVELLLGSVLDGGAVG